MCSRAVAPELGLVRGSWRAWCRYLRDGQKHAKSSGIPTVQKATKASSSRKLGKKGTLAKANTRPRKGKEKADTNEQTKSGTDKTKQSKTRKGLAASKTTDLGM